MPHTSSRSKLSRKKGPRTTLLKNLSRQLIHNKRMTTSLAKAKTLARYIAHIITRAKRELLVNPRHAHRNAFAVLQRDATKVLFEEVLPKTRQSGYTRIIKLAPRAGDRAEQAFIELVDFSIFTPEKKEKTKTRRSRKKTNAQAPPQAKADTQAADSAHHTA